MYWTLDRGIDGRVHRNVLVVRRHGPKITNNVSVPCEKAAENRPLGGLFLGSFPPRLLRQALPILSHLDLNFLLLLSPLSESYFGSSDLKMDFSIYHGSLVYMRAGPQSPSHLFPLHA
jgi:hypothetical protein